MLRPASTNEVAKNIFARYQTEKERFRASYSWVTRNIRYDTDSAFAINAGANENAKVDVAFKRRRGVCENFAAIFADICNRAGLKSYVVQGYTRTYAGVRTGGHTWCAGLVDGDWYFFDPTWDVGGTDRFFMIEPTDFIKTHMPFDPIWQLLEYPVSNADFERGIFNRSWVKTKLNYRDSISDFLSKESDIRNLDIEKRMANAGMINDQVKTNYAVIKMNIEMKRQEYQVNWYDSAVHLVNQSTNLLNLFIENRNKGIFPVYSDVQLNAAATLLHQAKGYLKKIDESEATLVLGTWQVRERIDALEVKLGEQKSYLKELAKNQR